MESKTSIVSCRKCGHGVTKNTNSCETCGAFNPAMSKPQIGFGFLALAAIVSFGLYSCNQMSSDIPSLSDQFAGGHCLSSWNGSHPELLASLKKSMKDPSTFEHTESRISKVGADDFHVIYIDYRAKNSFGATVNSSASGRFSSKDCSFEIVSAGI